MAIKDFITKGNAQMAGHITVNGYIAGPANFIIDPAGVGDNTGTVVIAGDLQVDGTQTTVNSTTLDVSDLNITVAKGAVNSAAANGAGLTVDGASATLTYSNIGDKFVFNKPLDVTGNIGVTGTVDGVDIAARDAVLTSTTTMAGAALPKAGGAMTGPITTNSTFDGVDIATRDAVLTATTTTANAALPKAGGTLTGKLEVVTTGNDVTADFQGANGKVKATRYGHLSLQNTDNSTTESFALSLRSAGGMDISYGTPNASHSINTSGSIMRFSNDFKVGIGTTSPQVKLQVNDTGTAVPTSGYGTGFNVSRADGLIGMTMGFRSTNNAMYIQARNFTNTDSQPLLLNPNGGNVGIGTTSPQDLLHLNTANSASHIRLQRSEGDEALVDGDEIGGIEFWANDGSYASNVPQLRAAIRAETQNTSSGTRLEFWTGNSGSAVAERMRIIADGNVGIGTTNPGFKLQVDHGITAQYASSIRNTADNLQLLLGTTTGGLLNIQGKTISSNAAYDIALQAEGGNVGIGTASPTAPLDVRIASAAGKIAEFHNTTGYGIDIGSDSDSVGYISSGYTQNFAFKTNAGSGQVERVRIDSNGNVGIGTSAVYGKLGIGSGTGGGNVPANTSILLGSDDNRNIQFLAQTANGNEGTIGAWNGVYNFQSSKIVFNKPAGNLGEMLFYTNAGAGPVLRVAMTNHGRVVFSPTGVADGQGVTTYANGANGHYVSVTGTSNYWITNHGVASATGVLSTFYNNGTYCGGINISSTNVTSYVSASDYRLKENVTPMTGATERLKQLNPVTFDWINSGESSEGFIAHEVGAIVPISTTGTKDEVYDQAGSDDNPNIDVGDPKYQSVDPAKLVPLLVKTIQELEARITALESA